MANSTINQKPLFHEPFQDYRLYHTRLDKTGYSHDGHNGNGTNAFSIFDGKGLATCYRPPHRNYGMGRYLRQNDEKAQE